MENEAQTDTFELSLRILGNEIIGMKLSSQSKAKNWAFFGLLSLVAITILVNELLPSIISLSQSVM